MLPRAIDAFALPAAQVDFDLMMTIPVIGPFFLTMTQLSMPWVLRFFWIASRIIQIERRGERGEARLRVQGRGCVCRGLNPSKRGGVVIIAFEPPKWGLCALRCLGGGSDPLDVFQLIKRCQEMQGLRYEARALSAGVAMCGADLMLT
eukprot:6205018-Pleurochrysis_carterae.AAC.1